MAFCQVFYTESAPGHLPVDVTKQGVLCTSNQKVIVASHSASAIDPLLPGVSIITDDEEHFAKFCLEPKAADPAI